MSAGGHIMKMKTGLKAGQDYTNSANVNVNVAQNSGQNGTATAGGPPPI
jgi:hypothetical protein